MVRQRRTVRHPCAGRSKSAVEVFEAIAIGQDPPQRLNTIKALLKAGLIIKIGSKEVGSDMFGPIRVPVYGIPIDTHSQWCKWCAENDPDQRPHQSSEKG
jgi:hypothetical protein